MKEPDMKITGNPELDQVTLDVLDVELKLLDEDMRVLQHDLETLRLKRQRFANWRQKLLFTSEAGNGDFLMRRS